MNMKKITEAQFINLIEGAEIDSSFNFESMTAFKVSNVLLIQNASGEYFMITKN